jgi:single-strand DNA-binding protein
MNVFSFSGNIGQDAELREVNGSYVCNLSVANNIGYGENKKTLWVKCAIWGQQAEKLHPMLTRGTKVFVSGNLDLTSYEKKDGSEGYNLDVRVRDIQLLGRNDDERTGPAPQPAPQVAAVQGGRGKW